MAYKRSLPFSVTLASNTTLTSELDMTQSYDRVLLGIPTMASGCNVLIQMAGASGGTYRNLYYEPKVDSTTPVKISIDSSITQAYVPLNCGAQFVKIELSTAMTATSVDFEVVGLSL